MILHKFHASGIMIDYRMHFYYINSIKLLVPGTINTADKFRSEGLS